MITVEEPFVRPFERIPRAYQMIMEHLKANNFRQTRRDDVLSCFEHTYRRDGTEYMDVFVHVDDVIKANALPLFRL